MIRVYTFLFLSAFVLSATAQTAIPNGDFESWTSLNGAQNPVRWKTIDDVLTVLPFNLPSQNLVVQETDPANVASGSSSALLTTKGVSFPIVGDITFAGSMSIGNYGLTPQGLTSFQVTLGGVAYTDRPDSIELSYKYKLPSGQDHGTVNVNLTHATAHDGTVTVGSATINLNPSNNFSTVKAKITYYSALNPDTLKIQIESSATTFGQGVLGGQLWVDNVHFLGYDTIFKAYLFPKTDQVRCEGDTIAIRTDEIAGDSYVWFRDGVMLPYSTYKIRVNTSGQYNVLVTHNHALWVSDTITLTVHPLPVVTFTGYLDTLCKDDAPIQLTGGSPAGGTYTGNGVRQGIFYPANASLGNKNLTYIYTDNNGCTASAALSRFYIVDCTVGISALGADAAIRVYPNPAKDKLYVTANSQITGGEAKVYDLQGRLVSAMQLASGQSVLDLSSVDAGYYSIQIANAAGQTLAVTKITVAK
ncbi:MAG: T9SS type A sorting domain-containing protein [Bacteroidetes bacterium]|nr:T9SS type A sorting domain-containing protein [Bacteroidota bacterium]